MSSHRIHRTRDNERLRLKSATKKKSAKKRVDCEHCKSIRRSGKTRWEHVASSLFFSFFYSLESPQKTHTRTARHWHRWLATCSRLHMNGNLVFILLVSSSSCKLYTRYGPVLSSAEADLKKKISFLPSISEFVVVVGSLDCLEYVTECHVSFLHGLAFFAITTTDENFHSV